MESIFFLKIIKPLSLKLNILIKIKTVQTQHTHTQEQPQKKNFEVLIGVWSDD